MPKFSVILAAAGRSTRFDDPTCKKPFALLNEKPIWLYSAELFLKRSDVIQLIVVVSEEDEPDFRSRFGADIAVMGIDVVRGGAERADSIELGLQRVDPAADFVAIHDAARPCIDADLIDRVFAAGVKHGAAIPTIPIQSTIKRSDDGTTISETVDRTNLYLAQTPQVFRRQMIIDLYSQRSGAAVTDESQLAEQHGQSVTMVKGSPLNIKITTKHDLAFASAALTALPTPRFDAPIHPFADDTRFR